VGPGRRSDVARVRTRSVIDRSPSRFSAATGTGESLPSRPGELAGDTTSSESALLHALDELDRDGVHADILVFLQATSPFISPDDLDDAIERVTLGESDVIFSAVETHAFLRLAFSPGESLLAGRELRDRDNGVLPVRARSRPNRGGALRRAWDRRRALGRHDRSLLGLVAFLIGWPMFALRRARRACLMAPAEMASSQR
jgi:hypothetical protein